MATLKMRFEMPSAEREMAHAVRNTPCSHTSLRGRGQGRDRRIWLKSEEEITGDQWRGSTPRE